MNTLLRIFFGMLLVVATLLGVNAQAEVVYPERPITLVVPYSPGGSADILARLVGQKLGERLGQPVVVENRAGAGTAIGARAVAAAPADGHTLLLGTVSSQAINPAMNKVGYDPLKAFTAVAPLASIPFVLVAHPSLEVGSVSELVAMAKVRPGKVGYASAGPGTSNHLAGELLAAAAQVSLLHVPYKGSAPALNDVLAGHVPVMFDLLTTALPVVQSGKLKALAVTSRERAMLLPRVPTVNESGLPNYEVTAWFGVFAPAGVPAPIVARLNAELTSVIQAADMQKHLRELGAEPELAGVDAYARHVREEVLKWGGVVKRAGLAP